MHVYENRQEHETKLNIMMVYITLMHNGGVTVHGVLHVTDLCVRKELNRIACLNGALTC